MRLVSKLLQVAAICSLLVFVSCQNKTQGNIDNLNKVIENIEKAAPNYNEQQWKDANEQVKSLVTKLSEEKGSMNATQLKETACAIAKYSALSAKYGCQVAFDKGIDFASDIKDNAKGILNNIKDGVKDAVNDAKDGAKDLVDKSKDAVNDAKDGAKDLIEKGKDAAKDAKDKATELAKKAKDKVCK